MDQRVDHRLLGAFFVVLTIVIGYLFDARDPAVAVQSRRPQTDGPARVVADSSLKKIKSAIVATPTLRNEEGPEVLLAEPTDICAFLNADGAAYGPKQLEKLLKKFSQQLSPESMRTLDWLFQLQDQEQNKGGYPLTRRPASADTAVNNSTAPPTELLFLEGLEEGGMLLGRSAPRRLNVQRSVELLEKAQNQDQNNGALDLYLASLYQRQGRTDEALQAFHRGLRKDRFDVYMPGISKKILAAPQNSIEFLKAVELFSRIPIPDLTPVRESLFTLSRSEEFQGDIYHFAEKIVDDAVVSRAPYNHLDWWLSSYVMAGHLLQRRGQSVLRPFDLHQEFNRFPEIPNVSMNEACDSDALERSIQDFQKLIRQSVVR